MFYIRVLTPQQMNKSLVIITDPASKLCIPVRPTFVAGYDRLFIYVWVCYEFSLVWLRCLGASASSVNPKRSFSLGKINTCTCVSSGLASKQITASLSIPLVTANEYNVCTSTVSWYYTQIVFLIFSMHARMQKSVRKALDSVHAGRQSA